VTSEVDHEYLVISSKREDRYDLSPQESPCGNNKSRSSTFPLCRAARLSSSRDLPVDGPPNLVKGEAMNKSHEHRL
jgi:hypothetical protein